jgi:hypothetical protein
MTPEEERRAVAAALREVVGFVNAVLAAVPAGSGQVSPFTSRRAEAMLDDLLAKMGSKVSTVSVLWLFHATLLSFADTMRRDRDQLWSELHTLLEAKIDEIEAGTVALPE